MQNQYQNYRFIIVVLLKLNSIGQEKISEVANHKTRKNGIVHFSEIIWSTFGLTYSSFVAVIAYPVSVITYHIAVI